MDKSEIIKRLNKMLETSKYNEIDDPLKIGLLIEDIHESTYDFKYMSYVLTPIKQYNDQADIEPVVMKFISRQAAKDYITNNLDCSYQWSINV